MKPRKPELRTLSGLHRACIEFLPRGWRVTCEHQVKHECDGNRETRSESYTLQLYSADYRISANVEAPSIAELYRKFLEQLLPEIEAMLRHQHASGSPARDYRSKKGDVTIYQHPESTIVPARDDGPLRIDGQRRLTAPTNGHTPVARITGRQTLLIEPPEDFGD